MQLDTDKLVAAILATKACVPGTELYGYVLAYQQARKLLASTDDEISRSPRVTKSEAHALEVLGEIGYPEEA